MTKALIAVATIVLAFLIAPLSALVTSYGFSLIWGLLLSPQFGPGPSLMSWYGISILVATLTFKVAKDETFTTMDKVSRTVAVLVMPYVVYGLAAFVKLCLW